MFLKIILTGLAFMGLVWLEGFWAKEREPDDEISDSQESTSEWRSFKGQEGPVEDDPL